MRQKQYQVLARKWRPQQFNEVVGQEHVTTTLQNAIAQNRLAHAYLFVGPRGIGKTTIARIFAKALNCQTGPTVTPCDQCDSCQEIAAGRSLDVHEFDAASNTQVEKIRELILEKVQFRPTRGKYKIYLVDEVHMLSVSSFNALLKTLEEPPPHVIFFFATTDPQKLPSTILSRCQRYDLRRIPADKIVSHLAKIAKAEKVTVEPAALAAIARGAEGGLRDAESALDQLIAFCGDNITEADVLDVFGLVAHAKLAGLTDALIDGNVNTALQIVKELDEVGKDLPRLLADVLDHFRNLLVLVLAGDQAGLLEVPDTSLALLRAQATRVDADALLRMIDVLTNAEGRLRFALTKRVFLEIALIRAIKARELTGLEAVLKKLNELKNNLMTHASVTAPEPPAAAPAVSPAASAPPPTRNIHEAWVYAVEHLGKALPLAKSYLVGAQVVGFESGVLTVGFDPEFADQRELADTPRTKEILHSKLKERLRTDVAVKFVLTETVAPVGSTPVEPAAPTPSCSPTSTPSSPHPAPVAPRGAASAEEFKNDPLIKKALEIFKGTIVDVRQ